MLVRRGRKILITDVEEVEEEAPPVPGRLGGVLVRRGREMLRTKVEAVEEETPPVPGRLGRVRVRRGREMLITEVGEREEEGISLDGSPPVPNKREEGDEEGGEEGEERMLEGEMVKELEVKRLGD